MNLLAEAGSAPVTQWGPRLLLTLAVLAVIGLGIWGMRRGWQARAARQGDLPAPAEPPAQLLAECRAAATTRVVEVPAAAGSRGAAEDRDVAASGAAGPPAGSGAAGVGAEGLGAAGSRAATAPIEGMYVATTTAGDLLDRIVVHGLGHRGRARLVAYPEGVLIDRIGEVPLWIPRDDLRAVRLGDGQAQKAYEKGGLILIRWRLGGAELETGFRGDDPEQHIAAAQALAALIPGGVR